MLKAPILYSGCRAEQYINGAGIFNFLHNIFKQPLKQAKRRETNYSYGKLIENELKKKQRISKYYEWLNQWYEQEKQGISISKKFKNFKFKNIAIYGYGMLGAKLFRTLTADHISISYIIDKNPYIEIPTNIKPLVKKLTPEQICTINDLQCIILTTLHVDQNINNLIYSKFPNIIILTLDDLLFYNNL